MISLAAFALVANSRGLPEGSVGWNTGPVIIKMASDSYEATGISNGSYIAKNQLATYNGNQYMCYYNTTLNPIIVKRNLTTNAITSYNPGLPAVAVGTSTDDDVHKSCSIELDSTGIIHLSYGMHGDPLIYYRSNTAENASAFTSETPMVNATPENSSTYPMFVKNASGALFFTYRSGIAGNGDQYFYAYNTTTHTWSAAAGTGTNGIIISGEPCPVSAYLNGLPKFDASGNLWFQWQFYTNTSGNCTGATPPAIQNEYLMEWTGSAFKNVSGTTLTIPVTWATSPEILAIAANLGLADQNDFAIDQSSGVFYISYPHLDVNSTYQTYMLTNFSGSFVEKQLTNSPTYPVCFGAGYGATPVIKSGTVYAIYQNGYPGNFGPPTVAQVSSNGYTSFTTEVVTQKMNPNNFIAVDPERLSSGIASIAFENWTTGYMQTCNYPIPDVGSIYVIDWTIQ